MYGKWNGMIYTDDKYTKIEVYGTQGNWIGN